jgi:hypothetical protein
MQGTRQNTEDHNLVVVVVVDVVFIIVVVVGNGSKLWIPVIYVIVHPYAKLLPYI